MTGLSIRGLGFETEGRTILSGLDLDVRPGRVHALIGTNGTGKSTLASLIMGLGGYSPTGGTIFYDGRDISALAIHERAALGITLAWQEPVRFEGLSVEDYLGLVRPPSGDGPALSPDECLELVGLTPSIYLKRMVDRALSGGERKRVELAGTLAMGPRLAILDEPDSGIDILSIKGVLKVIRAFRDSGAGVLVITHREEIARAADMASLLCMGRITRSGDPAYVSAMFRRMECVTCGAHAGGDSRMTGRECEDA